MKKYLKVGLLLLFIGIVGTTALLLLGVRAENQKVMEKRTFEGEHLKNMTVRANYAEVLLHISEDDKVRTELKGTTGKGLKTEYHTIEDKENLEITLEQKNKTFLNFDFNMLKDDIALHIYLPKKTYDLIDIRTNVGDISSELKLEAKRAKLITNMGEVKLKGFQGEEFISETTIGDVTLHDLDSPFNIKTAEGSVSLQLNEINDQNKIKTTLGEVDVEMKNEPAGVNLDISTQMGEIQTDLPVTTEGSQSSDTLGKELKGFYGDNANNNPNLSIKTEMGDITLNK
ncbi:DUF4097 family beta strand repeat-containing protein [Metabacillus arenae]|uniref:DUF4097 family beta strand repeat protein n=1 Tax=Metabacillus arenae TaxID=2771434 RepID=A0A926RZ58_9BACI|nr:DUF4097 family beta strand repeat-containing protein [Metabacillus arenae]MBD1382475.1 DUF4097 family beta strand repeat protein [Metabacillus arenae]